MKHLGKKIWAGVSEEEWNVCRGDEEGLAGLTFMPRNKTDFGDLQKLRLCDLSFSEIMANAESESLGISFVPVISGGKVMLLITMKEHIFFSFLFS